MNLFTGVKVFCATMREQRSLLGDLVTGWLAAHPELEVVDVVVRQSSDSSFHCQSIVVFYQRRSAATREQSETGTKLPGQSVPTVAARPGRARGKQGTGS